MLRSWLFPRAYLLFDSGGTVLETIALVADIDDMAMDCGHIMTTIGKR